MHTVSKYTIIYKKFIIYIYTFLYVCMYIGFDREIYNRYRASSEGKMDVHTRLMRKYKDIPTLWFYVLLVVAFLVSLALCIFLKKEIQMPYWGLIFAAFLAFIFTLPISIITATTNQVRLVNIIYYYPKQRILKSCIFFFFCRLQV